MDELTEQEIREPVTDDKATVIADFSAFHLEKRHQDYMHAPPLPVSWLKPFAGVLGWHLWVHLKPRKT